ncbi:hypothetical protein [Spiroplasma endosymbiont of Zeiraphera isertana]|uniref:hypothetical protein n=1 Tax=Spiroplasma endosymbiont of Zeiraphera isertana TaxID=3066313 RepID=UPI00313D2775
MVAAPKKKPEDLMIKQIIVHLRFTEKDYEKLKEICEEKNMKINGFIRSLNKKAINRKSDKNE